MRRALRRFIRYYQWHLIFSLLVLVCLLFVYNNMTAQVSPDLTIAYAGTRYINTQDFMDCKAEIELLLKDANGDEKKLAGIYARTGDLQRDINEVFAEIVDSGAYDIYIADKETFESYEDKTAFASSNTYVTFGEKEYSTIQDSSGRIYAVSIEDNTIAERMGFVNTKGLYIAASAANKKGDITDFKKNGRNITGYIIENKEKYNLNSMKG